MKLMTKELREKIPTLYYNEKIKDPMVVAKFFNPTGAGTWYVLEYDGEDTLFTYVKGLFEDELGYTSLSELQTYRGRFGLGIERDLYFTPCRLSEVK